MKQTLCMMILCLALFSGCRPKADKASQDTPEASRIDAIARPVKKIMHCASPKPHFYTMENMGKLWSDITHKNKKP